MINIKNRQELFSQAYYYDRLFFEYFKKRGSLNYIENTIANMTGGYKNKITVKYMNEKFIFEKNSVDEYILSDLNNVNDCVVIGFDEKSAIIKTINSSSLKCGINIVSFQGRHLINITTKLLKKYKDKFGVNKIILTDDSKFSCNNKFFNASLYLLLTRGITFYGKYGFIPLDKEKYKTEKKIKKKIEKLYLNEIDFNKILEKSKKNKKDVYNMINKNIMKTIIKKLNENNNNLYLNVMKAIFTKDNLLNDSICYFYIMIKDELIKYFVKKFDILFDTNIIRVLYI